MRRKKKPAVATRAFQTFANLLHCLWSGVLAVCDGSCCWCCRARLPSHSFQLFLHLCQQKHHEVYWTYKQQSKTVSAGIPTESSGLQVDRSTATKKGWHNNTPFRPLPPGVLWSFRSKELYIGLFNFSQKTWYQSSSLLFSD